MPIFLFPEIDAKEFSHPEMKEHVIMEGDFGYTNALAKKQFRRITNTIYQLPC